MNIDAAQNPPHVPAWPTATIRGTAGDASQTDEAARHVSTNRPDRPTGQADGVSHAEQYQKTSDRDVDGRLPWQPHDKSSSSSSGDPPDCEQSPSKSSGRVDEKGGQLDVSA